ncbi:MAG: sulfatase-like hydrolase/transferase, partial [Planctomycetota bacterium]
GHDDLGSTNPRVVSPALDRLAEESARLTDFHVHLKCAPTRASLLTGRYFQRTGVWGVHGGRDQMAVDEVTLGDAFREAGYATAVVGKWHSGLGDRYYPWERGFDLAHATNLYRYRPEEGAADLVNGDPRPIDGWAQTHITDAAIGFVTEPRDRPFFLYLPYMSPHSPWRSPAKFQRPFIERGDDENLVAFWGMVHFMDHEIGRLLAAIDQAGLRDDTLVVFLSDNGPVPSGANRPPGEAGPPFKTGQQLWRQRNPSGMRGGKGQIYQNGLRSVFFARWPGRLEPGDYAGPVTVEDVFPTLLDWAGVTTPSGTKPLDGVSVTGLMRADAETQQAALSRLNERPLFFPEAEPKDSFDPWRLGQRQEYQVIDKTRDPERFAFDRMNLAVRRGDFKWVKRQGKAELFNLVSDPRERTPITDRADLARELEAAGRGWWEDVLSESSAFERPTVYVDGNPRRFSVVQLRAASEVEGVSVHAHGVDGWDEVGDRLTVNVEIGRPGRYRVRLLGKTPRATQAVFELSIGSASPTTARIDRPMGLVHEKPEYDWDPKRAIDLGEVELAVSGPARLVLRLKELGARKPALDGLTHLVMERID